MIRRFLVLLLWCASFPLAHPFATAAPVGDNCIPACQQKNTFIGSNNQKVPQLRCWQYDTPGYCLLCISDVGVCKDPGGPTLPSCARADDQINLNTYSSDSCAPICNLLLGQTSEATAPTGNPLDSGAVTRFFCTAP
jgi:hypothetical protein